MIHLNHRANYHSIFEIFTAEKRRLSKKSMIFRKIPDRPILLEYEYQIHFIQLLKEDCMLLY